MRGCTRATTWGTHGPFRTGGGMGSSVRWGGIAVSLGTLLTGCMSMTCLWVVCEGRGTVASSWRV